MKNTDITIIAAHLDTEDAFFYNLQTGGESVSGLFEYVIERRPDEDILGAVPFCIDIEDVVYAAQQCKHITDYETTRNGLTVWEFDGIDGENPFNASDWLAFMVEFRENEVQEILTEAVRRVWTAHIESLAVEVMHGATSASIADRLRADRDENFCSAILQLADIIRANNAEWAKSVGV